MTTLLQYQQNFTNRAFRFPMNEVQYEVLNDSIIFIDIFMN